MALTIYHSWLGDEKNGDISHDPWFNQLVLKQKICRFSVLENLTSSVTSLARWSGPPWPTPSAYPGYPSIKPSINQRQIPHFSVFSVMFLGVFHGFESLCQWGLKGCSESIVSQEKMEKPSATTHTGEIRVRLKMGYIRYTMVYP